MPETKKILVSWIGQRDFNAAKTHASVPKKDADVLGKAIEQALAGMSRNDHDATKFARMDLERLRRKWLPNESSAQKNQSSVQNIELGPLGHLFQKLEDGDYDRVVILNNYGAGKHDEWADWMSEKQRNSEFAEIPFSIQSIPTDVLPDPTDHRRIWNVVENLLEDIIGDAPEAPQFTFFVSPGTPQMQTVFILLAESLYPDAKLIRVYEKSDNIIEVKLPEALAVGYFGALFNQPVERSEEFESIVCSQESTSMRNCLDQAEQLSGLGVRVLIEGETGTGKSMIAQAIHNKDQAKKRKSGKKPGNFVAINCGAIPGDLVESTLFGHTKGAFTGAVSDHPGVFEAANNGTLFLDEIGDLPLQAQVKLLLALDSGEITRVGSTIPIRIDVRVIAATHRSLSEEVAAGSFRADLYYRISRFTLQLPPLRERDRKCTEILVEQFKKNFLYPENQKGESKPALLPGWSDLDESAWTAVTNYRWPGNVRELEHVIWRAQFQNQIAPDGPREWLTGVDIHNVLPATKEADWFTLDAPLPLNLKRDIFDKTMAHYIDRALRESKTKYAAAAALKIKHQTLTYHMNRLRDKGLLDRKPSST
jgi:DNA-binding NtrC family response regulator